MSAKPTTVEYERLVEVELKAASAAVTDEARKAHLNRAAVYAYLSEQQATDQVQLVRQLLV